MFWFFCKLRIKANSASARIAASPLSLHLLDVKFVNRDAHYRSPSCNEGRKDRSDLVPIELGNNFSLSFFTCPRTYAQEHLPWIQLHIWHGIHLKYLEKVTLSPEVMAF